MALNAPALPETLEALRSMARGINATAVAWQRMADRKYAYAVVTMDMKFDVGAELRKIGGKGSAGEGSITLTRLLTP
jgi:GTPase